MIFEVPTPQKWAFGHAGLTEPQGLLFHKRDGDRQAVSGRREHWAWHSVQVLVALCQTTGKSNAHQHKHAHAHTFPCTFEIAMYASCGDKGQPNVT